jgi:Winged helix-turn helix
VWGVALGPSSPYVVVLGEADRCTLQAVARRSCAEHRQVLRARIVLAAAEGDPNAVIARRLATTDDTVRKWRKRFCRDGLPGLLDRPRSGRPRMFPAAVVAEVKAVRAENYVRTGQPACRYSRRTPPRRFRRSTVRRSFRSGPRGCSRARKGAAAARNRWVRCSL